MKGPNPLQPPFCLRYGPWIAVRPVRGHFIPKMNITFFITNQTLNIFLFDNFLKKQYFPRKHYILKITGYATADAQSTDSYNSSEVFFHFHSRYFVSTNIYFFKIFCFPRIKNVICVRVSFIFSFTVASSSDFDFFCYVSYPLR